MKQICVTGGAGFLGSHIVARLRAMGHTVSVPRIADYNLLHEEDVDRMMRDYDPDIIIHAAATVGGIAANQKEPGRFLYENCIMGLQLMEAARDRVEKFVQIGSACEYPSDTPVPFQEDYIWQGYPENSNAPYGISKRLLLVQGQAYRKQYGMNVIHLVPTNLYGPRDNFDLGTSHVIPALVNKFTSGADVVEVWGTGAATRDFLYVDDCAEAVVLAMDHYNGADPVNLGAGVEIPIKTLVELISKKTLFRGQIAWDSTKPDGQMRRCLDVTRAQERFGFVAKTSLETGIERTIKWFLNR